MVAIFPNSNFQSGVIFILIIAVPFFIALVIIHILFAAVWNDSEPCESLCAIPSKDREYFPLIHPPEPPIINITTTEDYMRNTLHPSIAALLEVKSGDEIKLKCAIGILSTYLAMSTQKCLNLGKNLTQIKDLRIRLGSDNWQENGVVTKVDQVLYSRWNTSLNNSFALLRFTVEPSIRNQIVILKLPRVTNVTILNPRLYFFNEKNMLDSVHINYLPVACCHIHDIANATEVCAFTSLINDIICDDIEDSPLIAGNYLMGMHDYTTDCDNGLVDILKTSDIDWSEYVLASDQVTRRELKKW